MRFEEGVSLGKDSDEEVEKCDHHENEEEDHVDVTCHFNKLRCESRENSEIKVSENSLEESEHCVREGRVVDVCSEQHFSHTSEDKQRNPEENHEL